MSLNLAMGMTTEIAMKRCEKCKLPVEHDYHVQYDWFVSHFWHKHCYEEMNHAHPKEIVDIHPVDQNVRRESG